MSKKYLSSFADQESALSYTGGGDNLVTPQVSLIDGDNELVYSGDLPHDFDIKFKLDESTGKLYIVIGELTMEIGILKYITQAPQCDYQMVDLGLPSGTKWADRNVGAATPQDNGMYFSWGNTKGVLYELKNMSVVEVVYTMSISNGMSHSEIISEFEQLKQEYGENWEQIVLQMLIQGGLNGLIEGTTFDWENTPYCTVDSEGNPIFSKYNDTDGLTTLEEMDDAATQWMGTVEVSGEIKTWRMPTSAETNELVNNTTQTVDELNGVSGMRFTSKTNDNSIFIPFAGNCSGGLLSVEGLYGFVWSGSVDSGSGARFLGVNSDGGVSGGDFSLSLKRYGGHSVRGVVG